MLNTGENAIQNFVSVTFFEKFESETNAGF